MSKKLYISALIIALLLPLANVKSETYIQALKEYFDLVVSGNSESAYYLWTDESRERASRFGISYDNIPLKIDCYSPIVKNVDIMRDYLNPGVKRTARMPRGFVNLLYSAIVNGELIEYTYYMRNVDDYFWLTFPQDQFAIDWEIKESKYFRIKYDKSLENSINEISIAEADNFIESISKQLKFSKDELKNIADKKIEYFFCESDKRVQDITGHLVKGTYDMPSNDIISAFFPHHHEIVHLLVNYKIKSLPLYALPLLREGSAVHFGGRWGKAPKTLEVIGEFLISEDIVSIDSILTFSDFNKVATSNIAYSVSGLFSGYLVDRIGVEKYFILYNELSGGFDEMMLLSASAIKQKFVDNLKVESWELLQTDFRKYLDKVIANAPMSPGITTGGDEIYNSNGIIIRDNKDFYTFEISALENDTVSGNLLFDFQNELVNKQSSIFEEQYKLTQEFSGHRFGVRYDQNEVGVYDYATNHLTAKYIWSLNPSENYFDEIENKLYFKFKKDVLPLKLSKNTEFIILAN